MTDAVSPAASSPPPNATATTTASVDRRSSGSRPSGPRCALTAINDWDLTGTCRASAPTGLEGMAWVPDCYLTATGSSRSPARCYDPTTFPNHGNGLFLSGSSRPAGLRLRARPRRRHLPRVPSRELPVDVIDLVRPGNEGSGRTATTSAVGAPRRSVDTTAGPTRRNFVPGRCSSGPPGGEPQQRRASPSLPLRVRGWIRSRPSAPTTATTTATPAGRDDELPAPTIAGAAAPRARRSRGRLVRRARDGHLHLRRRARTPLSGACPVPVTLSTSGAGQSVTRAVSRHRQAARPPPPSTASTSTWSHPR